MKTVFSAVELGHYPALHRPPPPIESTGMKRFLLLATALLAFAGIFRTAAVAGAKQAPIRALMVCGGCCHDYTHQKQILSEGISARANVEWTVVQEDAPKGADERKHRVSLYEKPEWWKGYDVVVHNECFGYVDDNAFIEGITAAHKAGVAAVFLHCSSHSYRMGTTDEWRKCIGITSRSHEKNRDLTVKTLKAEHPAMKGFPPRGSTRRTNSTRTNSSGRTACHSRKPTARTRKRITPSSG